MFVYRLALTYVVFVKVPHHPVNHDQQVLHSMMKIQNQNHLGHPHPKFLQDQSLPHLGFHSIIYIRICLGSLARQMVSPVEHPQLEALGMIWTK